MSIVTHHAKKMKITLVLHAKQSTLVLPKILRARTEAASMEQWSEEYTSEDAHLPRENSSRVTDNQGTTRGRSERPHGHRHSVSGDSVLQRGPVVVSVSFLNLNSYLRTSCDINNNLKRSRGQKKHAEKMKEEREEN